MWVWPQLPTWGGSPPPLHCNWRTLLSNHRPSFPPKLFSAMLQEGAALGCVPSLQVHLSSEGRVHSVERWGVSGKKKEPKPKLFGPDSSGWGGGLPREGVGAKKFGMSFETQETKLFGRDIPGFCRDIPGAPKSLRKKVCVQFSSPRLVKTLRLSR